MGKRTFDKVDDFDIYAKNYRDEHSKNIKISGADSLYFAEYKIKYLQNFEENKPLKMLDIGSGDGAVENFIQKHFPLWHTTGIDVSAESIAVANSRKLQNTNFQLFNGINLPFQDETMDIVFIANVLHHIKFDEHAALLKEIKRVMQPNGRLYIFEHNPKNPFTRYLVKTCIFDENAVLLKTHYLKNLLKNAGFKIQTWHYLLFFPRNKIFSFFHYFEKFLIKISFGAQYFAAASKK